MDSIKTFLSTTQFQAFAWTTLNAIVAIVCCYLTDTGYEYAALAVPIMNTVTKELRRAYDPNFK